MESRSAAESAPSAAGPLAGLRVIELGSIVAGPFAGRLLADYGADVIKVESAEHPDPLREWGQQAYRGHHLWWTIHARNKRCITLELDDAGDRETFLALVETADVVIENFRPGTLEGWDLGYERLRERQPRIILARISGFGQTGPYRQRPGYASVAEAMGGLRYINGYPGQAPPRMAVSLGDSLGGLFAVQGVLAALYHRDRSGEGQVVDIALTEACLALLESAIPEYDRLGRIRQPSGTRLDGIAPSNLYRAADGTWVIVAANQDTVFTRLCAAMGTPELSSRPEFADHVSRGRNQDALDQIVGQWVGARPAAEVMSVLEGAGVVTGPVYSVADIADDPQFRARDMLVEHFDARLGEAVLGPGIVPKFSRTPGAVRWAGPPRPGYHNAEVISGLRMREPQAASDVVTGG
jgi:formyl-CoA transferase